MLRDAVHSANIPISSTSANIPISSTPPPSSKPETNDNATKNKNITTPARLEGMASFFSSSPISPPSTAGSKKPFVAGAGAGRHTRGGAGQGGARRVVVASVAEKRPTSGQQKSAPSATATTAAKGLTPSKKIVAVHVDTGKLGSVHSAAAATTASTSGVVVAADDAARSSDGFSVFGNENFTSSLNPGLNRQVFEKE